MKHGTAHTYEYHKCRCRPCKDAHAAKRRKYRKPPTDEQRKYQREWQRKRRAELREFALDLIGRVCVECGTEEDIQFDHIDPATKVASISQLQSKQAIELEAPKCQSLCHECHVAKTKAHDDYNRGKLRA